MRRLFLSVPVLLAVAAAQQVAPAPVSVGIVFDTSGSLGGRLGLSRQMVRQVLTNAQPQDEFFLVTFADSPVLGVRFTGDPAAMLDRLEFIQPRGRSSLLDAIELAAHQMTEAKNARKVILVISDGGDNHSRYSRLDVEDHARQAGLRIYAIDIPGRIPETGGPDLLNELAVTTGGRHFAVSADRPALPDAATVVAEMRGK